MYLYVWYDRNSNRLNILECPIGYYGRTCENRCSEHCSVSRKCDSVTGQCYEGCQPGWYTKTCDQSRSSDTSLVQLFAISINIKRLNYTANQCNLKISNLNIWFFFPVKIKGFVWVNYIHYDSILIKHF